MYENRSDLYSLTYTKTRNRPTIFRSTALLFLCFPKRNHTFPCEKPTFSLRETYGFHAENIKQTKPKQHYLQQAFQSYQTKKSPEVQKHTSGDFSQDKLYSLNFFLQIQREFRHSPILGTYKCRSLYCQFMRFAYGLSFQDRSHESSSE